MKTFRKLGIGDSSKVVRKSFLVVQDSQFDEVSDGLDERFGEDSEEVKYGTYRLNRWTGRWLTQVIVTPSINHAHPPFCC